MPDFKDQSTMNRFSLFHILLMISVLQLSSCFPTTSVPRQEENEADVTTNPVTAALGSGLIETTTKSIPSDPQQTTDFTEVDPVPDVFVNTDPDKVVENVFSTTTKTDITNNDEVVKTTISSDSTKSTTDNAAVVVQEDATSAPKPDTTVAGVESETIHPEPVVVTSGALVNDDVNVVTSAPLAVITTPGPVKEMTQSETDLETNQPSTTPMNRDVENTEGSVTDKSATTSVVAKPVTTSPNVGAMGAVVDNQMQSSTEQSAQETTEKPTQAPTTTVVVITENHNLHESTEASTDKITQVSVSSAAKTVTVASDGDVVITQPSSGETDSAPTTAVPSSPSTTTGTPSADSPTTTSINEPILAAVKEIPSETVNEDSYTTTAAPQQTSSSIATAANDIKQTSTSGSQNAISDINVPMETTTRAATTPSETPSSTSKSNDASPPTTPSLVAEDISTSNTNTPKSEDKPLLGAVGPQHLDKTETTSSLSSLPESTTPQPITQAPSSPTSTQQSHHTTTTTNTTTIANTNPQINDTIILEPVEDTLNAEVFEAKRDNDGMDKPKLEASSIESDDPQTANIEVVNVTMGPLEVGNTTSEKVPFLLDLEKAEKDQNENGSGDGDSHDGVHDHDGTHGDDHDDNHTGAAHHGDSPEDRENKKRTAIIVGVAVGGVALFTLAFFTSRHCRKYSREYQTKKQGDRDTIEFAPLNTSHPGIYEEMEARNPNGLYRQGPKIGPPSPRMHRKNEGKFEYPEVHKSSGPTLQVPNKRSQPSASSQSLSDEPFLSKHVDKIKYMDESTDDELDATPRETLLPSNGKSPDTTSAAEANTQDAVA